MRRAIVVGLVLALAGGGLWLLLRPEPRARADSRGGFTPFVPVESAPPPKPLRPRIVGKVLGDEPLEGVVVTWEGGSGTTDAKGLYRIDIPPQETAAETRLLAEAPDGRVGFGRCWIDPAALENLQADIPLLPAAGVFFVTEPRVAATLLVTQLNEMHGLPFPVPLPLLRAEAGEARSKLAFGKYEVIARADGFGRTKIAFEVAADTREVRVPLAAERKLKVLVRSKADGRWVKGARLRLFQSWQEYGTREAFTDEMGAAVLGGLNREDKLVLDVVGPGEVPQEEESGPSPRKRYPVPNDVDEMLVDLDPPRRVSWLVEPGDIPPPPDGTVIPLRKSSGTYVTPPAQGVMRGGRLWTEGWPQMAAIGEALGPAGTVARLFCALDSDEGTPTRFLRGCNITVIVHRPDGAPAAGVNVAVLDQGIIPKVQAATDAEGVAKLERIDGHRASLCILGEARGSREQIGIVDLRKGDVRVEYTLKARRAVEVLVLVDGAPALPPGRQLWFNGSLLEKFAANEEQGLMTGLLALRPGARKVKATCRATGFLLETAEIDVPPGDEPIRHTFTLRRGTDLRVRVVGTPPERMSVTLERQGADGWDTLESTAKTLVLSDLKRRPTEDGWIYPGLTPGTYRVRIPGGTIFGTATLEAGGPPAEIVVYSKVAAIRGRVEIPEGGWFTQCHLLLEGEGIETETFNPMFSNAIQPDAKKGTFEVFIPGDRRVKLSVRHKTFMPDPARGHVETVTGADDVVLVLKKGPSVRFRIPAHFEKYEERYTKNPKWARPQVEVRLYRDEPKGRPEFTTWAEALDREWKGSGFLPGTYTLWIDVPEAVPVVRRGLKLTEDTDLGDLPMEPGSTLRVRVLVTEPFAVPSMSVWARRLDEPRYDHGSHSYQGEDVLVVTGLAAGRYAVTVHGNTGTGGPPDRLLDEEIELDGVTEVERTIDLR